VAASPAVRVRASPSSESVRERKDSSAAALTTRAAGGLGDATLAGSITNIATASGIA